MVPANSSAYRYLHVNLNTVNLDATSAFYAAVFDGKETMRSGSPDDPPSSGVLLGVDRDCRTSAAFVYDHRGPRRCSANELVEWYDPKTGGVPYTDPNHVGIQALGYAVPDVDATVELALGKGASRTDSDDVSDLVGTRTVTVLDPNGIRVDISATDADVKTIRHVRQNVHNLDASVEWYLEVGYVEAADRRSATIGGRTVQVAELKLSDEGQRLFLVDGLASAGEEPYDSAYHAGIFRSALACEDTRAANERLRADGRNQRAELHETVLTGTKVGFLRLLILRDPDNVMVELVERDRGLFR